MSDLKTDCGTVHTVESSEAMTLCARGDQNDQATVCTAQVASLGKGWHLALAAHSIGGDGITNEKHQKEGAACAVTPMWPCVAKCGASCFAHRRATLVVHQREFAKRAAHYIRLDFLARRLCAARVRMHIVDV